MRVSEVMRREERGETREMKQSVSVSERRQSVNVSEAMRRERRGRYEGEG